jgi:hypothetical protein
MGRYLLEQGNFDIRTIKVVPQCGSCIPRVSALLILNKPCPNDVQTELIDHFLKYLILFTV